MSAGLIVERPGPHGNSIALTEWIELLSRHPDLRIRTEPYFAVVPKTAMRLHIGLGEADAEMLQGEFWVPFLRYKRGKLVTEYQRAFDDPNNLFRIKITIVAKELGAVIATDLDDEILDWQDP